MIRDTQTLHMLNDSVTRFVRTRLVPAESIVAETDEIPEELINDMRELGLFGMCIPEENGGLGLTMKEEVLVTFNLAWT